MSITIVVGAQCQHGKSLCCGPTVAWRWSNPTTNLRASFLLRFVGVETGCQVNSRASGARESNVRNSV